MIVQICVEVLWYVYLCMYAASILLLFVHSYISLLGICTCGQIDIAALHRSYMKS